MTTETIIGVDSTRKMNGITGKTRICGIMGDPVEHTISPAMHNACFSQLGLDFVYAPFRVRKEALSKAVEGVKALSIRGFNVSIPHKSAVIPFLDSLDPLAERIGAVNTVVNDDGVLKGYNTDAGGFLRALHERGIEAEGKRVVVLGAGGAARAIAFALAGSGADLTIVNRASGLKRALEIAENVAKAFNRNVNTAALEDKILADAINHASILVNATSVGMHPHDNESILPAALLKKGQIVVDIVYNPQKTRLLAEAEAAGCVTIGGLDMLVWQGAMAFELWTGVKPPVEVMKTAAMGALKRYED